MASRPAPIAFAVLLAACAAAPESPRSPAEERSPEAVAAARARDDVALAAAAADLAPLEDHFVAVAGGRFLGGAQLLEDATRLLSAGARGAPHAYFFVAGQQGDRSLTLPALYGPRVAGGGLFSALGLKMLFDPGKGVVEVEQGRNRRTFPFRENRATAFFTVEAASGLGFRRSIEFVASTGFAGTAVLSREDGEALGLERSEIPGEASLTESLTGRSIPCRRALARVALEPDRGDAIPPSAVLVEVLFPR